jgi:hypothetical protein
MLSLAIPILLSLATIAAFLGVYRLRLLYSPDKATIRRDLERMRGELNAWVGELVPLTQEELEQFSTNLIRHTRSKRFIRTAKGIFTSIYHEPLVAWTYRRYRSSKSNALLLARTTDTEYVYRIKPDRVEFAVNNEFVGVYYWKEGILRTPDRRGVPIALLKPAENDLLSLWVGERELASLPTKADRSKPNPRALEYLQESSPEEQKLLLSLTLFHLLKEEVR